MKTIGKRMAKAMLLFLVAAVAAIGVCTAYGVRASAADGEGRAYYYEELRNSAMAQKMYAALDDMAQNGMFAKGKGEYDLLAAGVVTRDEVIDYVDNGRPKIPVALGAARDAYYMDHPELFYADVYKVYLSAGMQNGAYVAYLGTGNADNYYVTDTVKSESEAQSAQTEFDAALAAAVSAARAGGDDTVSQITAANNYIAQNTEYDYGARDSGTYDGYVSTAYGALVNKKALCGGFARAFKAVMDELNIPCVLVQGTSYAANSVAGYESSYESHMWNAVRVDGLWYGVDVTWNEGYKSNRFLLSGEETMSKNHYEDGVISSSGFELKYPSLRPLDYGKTQDTSGFSFKDSGTVAGKEFGYIAASDKPDKKRLELGVSYDGKNSAELETDGKYLARRYLANDAWSVWSGINEMCRLLSGEQDLSKIEGVFYEQYTLDGITPEVKAVQYAVMDYKPDNVFSYDPAKLTDGHIIALSTVYGNSEYLRYMEAPYVVRQTPNATGMRKSFDPLPITLTYSEELVRANGDPLDDASLRLSVTSAKGDMSNFVTIENLHWDAASKTLSFVFTPSKMYAHNCESYLFTPIDCVGKDSRKAPETGGYYTFKMKQVVCPKVFNDGRLYMQVFGKPQFVGAEDMSLTEFKDKNGQPVAGNQRSQLMLVVNEPPKAETQAMKDKLVSESDLESTDILAASTYQIDLHLCGVVQKVPSGSYMQVGFGFPDGYGPESKGVTFTAYHYTRKPDGTVKDVQEIPCVVTEYGIIATVHSFSPFMVCAIPAEKASADRNVYAHVEGAGGTLGENQTQVLSVQEGTSVTYTFTPEAGYSLASVLLGDTDVTDKVEGTALTLSYEDLAKGSEVEFTFIADSVKTYRTQNNLQVARPRLVVRQSDMIAAVAHEESADAPAKSNTAMIVVIVILCVVIVGLGVALALVLLRNKKGGTPANKAPAKSKKEEASARKENAATVSAPRPAQNTQRPVQSAPRTVQSAPRPVQNVQRPVQPAQRPAQNAQRPMQPAQRPAQNTQRPAQTGAPRPASAQRPAPRPAQPPRKDGK